METIQKISYEIYKLNDKGQSVAVDRVEELTKIPDYQLREEPLEVAEEATKVKE